MTITPPALPDHAVALELVPGRLHVLGASVELDGRISWVPAAARGWQPLNTYVLCEDDAVLVIDPGPYVHRHIVREQLERILAPGRRVSVFVTRAEPDITGNLGELAGQYPVDRLFAGGGPNPFDAFEAVTLMDPGNRGERIQMERTPPGFSIELSAQRGVEVLRPAIRLLATWWGYDNATGTLFTSDTFGHGVQQHPTDWRLLSDPLTRPDPAQVRGHLLAKFGWLARAVTTPIIENLRAMFADRDVTRIAPAHGQVIEGRGAVAAHLSVMEQVLQEISA